MLWRDQHNHNNGPYDFETYCNDWPQTIQGEVKITAEGGSSSSWSGEACPSSHSGVVMCCYPSRCCYCGSCWCCEMVVVWFLPVVLSLLFLCISAEDFSRVVAMLLLCCGLCARLLACVVARGGEVQTVRGLYFLVCVCGVGFVVWVLWAYGEGPKLQEGGVHVFSGALWVSFVVGVAASFFVLLLSQTSICFRRLTSPQKGQTQQHPLDATQWDV